MSYVREAALDWTRRALAEEFRDTSSDPIDEVARMLVAVADDYNVPVEELIRWIHAPREGKLAVGDWVRHCLRYSEDRKNLGLENWPRINTDRKSRLS